MAEWKYEAEFRSVFAVGPNGELIVALGVQPEDGPLIAMAPRMEEVIHLAARLDEVFPTVADCLRLRRLARAILSELDRSRGT